MTRTIEAQFFQFLEDELSLSPESISLALKQHYEDVSLLPITLWKCGMVTIDDVSSMFDWLANV
ncbi:MAG: DUF2949 domain-containing protein [Phormidesmis sp.]